MEWWMQQWVDGNNAGWGFAAGEQDADRTPEQAAQYECWEVLECEPDGSVLCRTPKNVLVAIADSHGPWAVEVCRDCRCGR